MTRKQKKMLLRIAVSAVLLVAAVLIPYEGPWRFLLFLPAYFVIGWDVLWRAIRNIAHGQVFDENFLMALATVGAFCTGFFGEGEYPEAVFVMLFYQVGELFQSYAVGKSRKSIASLMDIRPDYANVEREGKLIQVDPEEVAVGDAITVKAGERIPLDGVVLEGQSMVNTSALTGESVPRQVQPGDDVISGCVNQSGLLRVQVTKPFGESTVQKILDLVENSSSKKAKAENFITKFARYYTPIVVFGALALALVPPLFLGDWVGWVQKALIFLVVSCPCALVISVPLSFFGGIGGASRQGILVKGGNYLEVLANTEIVVFDKTGTLTQGVFNVTAIHPEESSESSLLEMAALAESYSDHPISRSLKEAYGKEIDASRVGEVEELSGRGVRAQVDGKTVCAGNDKLMEDIGVKWHPCHHVGTTVHVAVEGKYIGHIVISDEVKPDAKEAIAALKAQGVKKTVMLTGDAKAVGESVAKDLGLDEAYTQLLPGDKVDRVEALLSETSPKGKLAFVGDGINDAPVLSRADIGIAMGALGSDAAIEAADIVLMDDKPSKIAKAMEISKGTLRIVRQNIVFALAVKLLVLALTPFGLSNMWVAVFADVGVMVIAILNASRALQAGKK
ncbi:MAG TPA: cadmium-translocating P-type ATPase [Candidatus Acutalibacter pullicola]|uniref:Cadmium-translocating P-type ATPase n=1 Tax=Candidatus Acutalibacter pullicola TaxID=2838417 RepID=A0A9D2MUR5_9FIRM|nr:cadmium-translocating P-type ATPase [Candidatus Acutalibacter pullicola]